MYRGRQQFANMPPTSTGQFQNQNREGNVQFQPPQQQQQQNFANNSMIDPPNKPAAAVPNQKQQQPPRPVSFHHPENDADVNSEFENTRIDNLRKNTLFEDADFPATDRSIYYSRQSQFKFEWLRPHEIVKMYHSGLKPELFVGATNRFDVKQGKLGDCWVVAALSSLSENMEHIYSIIPRGQSFRAQWYAGMFRFRFWQFGRWVEVVIDDRLPTMRGELMFVHSNTVNEFWAALLEKAYAKMYGSYEALKAGHIADALTDFTGGLTESYPLGKFHDVPNNIVNIMFKSLERQSVIGASIYPVDPNENKRTLLPNGLVAGHAFSVTDMREIRLISERGEIPITLIRIRNPWGTRIEWNGPWSDRSPEWNSIPEPDKRAMGLIFRDDGEFWMDFRDFLTNFSSLDICNLSPQMNSMAARQWEERVHFNRWIKGVTAGGRPACKETHWMNPQFKVTLSDSDDDEDNLCSLIIELSQKDQRRMKHKNLKNLDIGFVIYQLTENNHVLPLTKKYFETYHYKDRCDQFIDARQNVKRFLLPPGEYVIVPSTYEPNEMTEFMLRMYFEKIHSQPSEQIDEVLSIESPLASPEKDPDLKTREEFFKKFFYDVAGENMQVDAYEFHQILNGALRADPNHKDINIDTCKAMVTLVDNDDNCRLGYNEFLHLWNLVRSWKSCFYVYDADHSGKLKSIELRNVLHSYGYKLNQSILAKLVYQYADNQEQVDLDSFIACMTRLALLFKIYKRNQKNDYVAMGLEQWIQEGVAL
ncbi:calpain-9-like isoform X2 [Tubulanus polymorphus]|uniref:calpain-9-like isoform X2 n=1 Tax=Tubulanus polymorphus TaxID=672921 RepID=UPI003DA560E1